MIEGRRKLRTRPARRTPAGHGGAEEFGIDGGERRLVRWNRVILEDRLHRADGEAKAAIDAFIGLDVHHPPALIDAVDRTDIHAGAVLHVDTGRDDDVGHRPVQRGSRFSRKARTPSSWSAEASAATSAGRRSCCASLALRWAPRRTICLMARSDN